MCGINGFLQPQGFVPETARATVTRMADAIAHRGPDDSGFWLDDEAGIALGFRRLAILDRSAAGKQPMISASGRYVIVFNGEIYNHCDLRQQLERRCPQGIRWRGHSDTEILLAAIDCWGLESTLSKTIGMFALTLWDRNRRVLCLARDRLGEKPLYYGWQSGIFLFGSELKALTAHPAFIGNINRQALALFLRHNYVPSPWSIYCGIHKLPAGTWLQLAVDQRSASAEEPIPQRYWSLQDAVQCGQAYPLNGNTDEAIDALHDVLLDAVKRQMVADVPLGAFLSGGIDSSVITALMQAQSTQPIRTFTIGFNESDYNEAPYAKAVAAHLGTDHTELCVSGQHALDVIPRLPMLYDEPFADSSQIPTFLIAQMTRRHVTVALSGDGGDELFGGYNRHLFIRRIWRCLAPIPMPLRRVGARAITAVSPHHWDRLASGVARLLRMDNLPSCIGDKAHKLAGILDSRSPEQIYQRLISNWESPSEVMREIPEPPSILTNLLAEFDTLELENKIMALDTLTYLPDDILTKVDRAAMGVSLETRAPFLDHRVVECAWRLPLSVKIHRNQSKWALRQILCRYVPEALSDRPKMGFGIPLGIWLKGPLREWAEALLDENRLRDEGFFDPLPIRQQWSQHLSGHRQWCHRLWGILMFQAWLESGSTMG